MLPEFTPESMIPVLGWGLSLLALLLFVFLANRLSKTTRKLDKRLEDIYQSLSNGKDNISERIEEFRIESARLDSCNREDWQREVSILSDRIAQVDRVNSERLNAVVADIKKLIEKLHLGLKEKLNDISKKSAKEMLNFDKRAAAQEDHISRLEQSISDIEKVIRESYEDSFGEIEEIKRQLKAHKEDTASRVEKLSDYLHEIFEKELRGVFNSFDNVITSVLNQMKGELLRGVSQIEDIQSVVASRQTAESLISKNEQTLNELLVESQQIEPTYIANEIGNSEDILQLNDSKSKTNNSKIGVKEENITTQNTETSPSNHISESINEQDLPDTQPTSVSRSEDSEDRNDAEADNADVDTEIESNNNHHSEITSTNNNGIKPISDQSSLPDAIQDELLETGNRELPKDNGNSKTNSNSPQAKKPKRKTSWLSDVLYHNGFEGKT